MKSYRLRAMSRVVVALLFLGLAACCQQTCPLPKTQRPIPTTNAGCLQDAPPPPQDWKIGDLVLAGIGDCPSTPTIAGCLSPSGAIKMRRSFGALFRWITEARRRCGKVPGK